MLYQNHFGKIHIYFIRKFKNEVNSYVTYVLFLIIILPTTSNYLFCLQNKDNNSQVSIKYLFIFVRWRKYIFKDNKCDYICEFIRFANIF